MTQETRYAYAVARIRAHEARLLTRHDMEQLLSCKTAGECMRILLDKGWGDTQSETAARLLASEWRKAWALIEEIAPDAAVFDLLRCQNDYHNLKAAIKGAAAGGDAARLFLPAGIVGVKTLQSAVESRDFSSLPEPMRAPAAHALELLLQTGDGQAADVILDRAALAAMLAAGEKSGSKMMAEYAERFVATTNLKIALRGQKTGKSADFLRRALAPCKTLNIDALAAAAAQGAEPLLGEIARTPYAGAVDAIRQSLPAFEKWCDDHLMALLLPAKANPFGPEPLFAYLLAKEAEIRAVRIILSAKLNDLPEPAIRERMRDLYV